MDSQGQAATGTPEQTGTAPETTDQTAVVGAEGQAAGNAVKDAAKEALRRHKLKVDGQEIEVDDDELKRGYTHQKAANKKLQEGLKVKRQAEEFIQQLKDEGTLFEAMKKLGHDPRALAEKYLAAQLEEEMLDPREKELKAYKAKVQAFEEQEKKAKEAKEQAARDEMKRKFTDDYTKQFTEALGATGLPATKEAVAKMARYISDAAKIKFELTPAEAAKFVREDFEQTQARLYGNADAETLIKLIGEQGMAKVRAHDVAKLRDPAANLKTPEQQGEPRRRQGGQRMTPQQWREFNRK